MPFVIKATDFIEYIEQLMEDILEEYKVSGGKTKNS